MRNKSVFEHFLKKSGNKIEGVMMMKKLIFLFVLIGIGSLFFGVFRFCGGINKFTTLYKIGFYGG